MMLENVNSVTEVVADALDHLLMNASTYSASNNKFLLKNYILYKKLRSCARDFYLESGTCREECHDGFYPDKTGKLRS